MRYFPILDLPGAAIQVANDFGADRSGGRKHAGNDILAKEGVPIVAVDDGLFTPTLDGMPDAVGNPGISFSLVTPGGTRYWGTHLARWQGGKRQVKAGEIIGYVGHSGNAGTINHLHFEIHPGGGPAIDPHPALMAAERLKAPRGAASGAGALLVAGLAIGAVIALVGRNR